MTDSLLYAAIAIVVVIAVPFVRYIAAHVEKARERRLKNHIDWINPEPQVSRRRKSAIRM